MRALLRKELGLIARQLPYVALSGRMLAIKPTPVKGGVARLIARQRLVLGGVIARRGLLPLLVPRSDGTPPQQQGTGLEHVLLGQFELGGKVGHGHATVTIDSRKHAIGTRDVRGIHAADGSIAAQQ